MSVHLSVSTFCQVNINEQMEMTIFIDVANVFGLHIQIIQVQCCILFQKGVCYNEGT